jgi:hypothetical protein
MRARLRAWFVRVLCKKMKANMPRFTIVFFPSLFFMVCLSVPTFASNGGIGVKDICEGEKIVFSCFVDKTIHCPFR